MPESLVHTVTSALGVIRPLGAPPLGSAHDVRAHAARLRAIADGLAPAQTLLAAAGQLDGGEGPAADRARDALAHELRMLEGRVYSIRQLAARLESEATSLEQAQSAWRRGLSRSTLGLPASLVDQALRQLGWKLP